MPEHDRQSALRIQKELNEDPVEPYEAATKQYVDRLTNARAARVYLNTAQSIPDSTWTQVEVDAITDDPGELFDSVNNRLTLDRAGWWLVSAGVGWDGDSGGARRSVEIAHNGSRIVRAGTSPVAVSGIVVTLADVVLAASGDTIEAQAWQDSGGSLGLAALEHQTRLSVAYLGAG